MPDVRAELIISVKDQASDPLKKVGGAGKKATSDLNKGFADAFKSVTGFNLASVGLAAGIGAVAAGLKAAVDKTIQWAGQIDQLSRVTGTSVRETSLLATVMGDVGISMGTLERASKALTKEGLQLNMETIKKLAKEYNAIEDPVERNAFAFKKFGRAALEMTEILTRTPEDLDALTAAAQRSGKVIGADMVANAEKLETQMKQLQDKMDGFAITVGGPVVEGLSKAITAGEQLISITQIMALKFQLATGQINEEEFAMKAAAAAGIELAGQIENATTWTGRLEYQTRLTADAISDQEQAEEDLKTAMENSNKVYALAEEALAKANIPLYDRIKAEQELALASGKVTEEELKTQEAIGFLGKQLDTQKLPVESFTSIIKLLADGSITAAEAIRMAQEAIAKLEGKDIYINYHYQQYGSEDFAGAGEGGAPAPPPPEEDFGGMRQHGGQVRGGRPVIVGEGGRAEMFVPRTSGMIYPSIPGIGGGKGGGGMGGGADWQGAAILTAIKNLPRNIRDAITKAY